MQVLALGQGLEWGLAQAQVWAQDLEPESVLGQAQALARGLGPALATDLELARDLEPESVLGLELGSAQDLALESEEGRGSGSLLADLGRDWAALSYCQCPLGYCYLRLRKLSQSLTWLRPVPRHLVQPCGELCPSFSYALFFEFVDQIGREFCQSK